MTVNNVVLGRQWQRSLIQVRLEVPVDGHDAEPWNAVRDYCLYDASGNVLTVVEAKLCSRNAREADEQLRHYVTEIAKKQPFAPFGFMANGHDIWFWEVGLANLRLVAGFFTPADLERLKFLRQNRSTGSAARGISSKNLAEIPIPAPPLPLQQKFAAVVERVERLRAVQREALRQAEHLFASLLHRAFRG